MSPTVFRHKGFRFFFFAREEDRMHIHVYCADGEAKFWLEPDVALAKNYGLSSAQLSETEQVIRTRQDEITDAWRDHFQS